MRLSLGSAEDRAAELARLAEVDSWYDSVYAAARRVDSGATISKHDTLATVTVQGRTLLLTGSMYSGDVATGKTPDQRIQEFLASVDVEYPAYTPAPDVAAVALIQDLMQSKWGVPIPNSDADLPRINEYYRRMSELQDSGYPSTYYPVEYPSEYAPTKAAVNASTLTNPGQTTTAQVDTSEVSVVDDLTSTAEDALGLDSDWVESNKWLLIAAAAGAAWFFFGRGK
jgi:hypothetical protein